MQRVAVIGSGGAGKSVLSLELGARTGLPVVHLDRLFWGPDWTPMPDDEWDDVVRGVSAGDRWIQDGNYRGTMDFRFARADTVVFMDLPRLVCLWGAISRWLRHRNRSRPDMAPGLNDKLDLPFLQWIWNYPRDRRPELLRGLEALPPTTRVVRLTSRRAVREWLETISHAVGSGDREAATA